MSNLQLGFPSSRRKINYLIDAIFNVISDRQKIIKNIVSKFELIMIIINTHSTKLDIAYF